jgi:hypothetical protein
MGVHSLRSQSVPSVKVFALTIRAVFAPIFLYKDGRKVQNVEKIFKAKKKH